MKKYNKRLVISLTEIEKETLARIANYEGGLSLAATLRHLIVEAARERNINDDSREKVFLDEKAIEDKREF